jgi:hypothetical protein
MRRDWTHGHPRDETRADLGVQSQVDEAGDHVGEDLYHRNENGESMNV